MKEIKIQGKTPEEKFNHLEIILRRMFRRLHKTVIGLVPSSPVFGFCADPSEGPTIIRALFPADGLITKAALRVAECEESVVIGVEVSSGSEKFYRSFKVKSKPLVEDVNFLVKAGDALEVRVEGSPEEVAKVHGVWVGFLYQVGIKDMAKTQIAIEQFEQLIGDMDSDN